MQLDKPLIGDIETKGFLDDLEGLPSELHVFSVCYYSGENWKVKSTRSIEDLKKVFEDPNVTIVGHNFFMFDIPAIEKMFKDIEIKCTIIDSLIVAWYIEPNRIKKGKKYGLESFGEEFGVPKPEIEDWTNLSYEEYKFRCEEDTKINTNTWVKHLRMLRQLYDNDDNKIKSLLTFLMTKGRVYKMQQDHPLLLDVKNCKKNLEILDKMIEDRVEKLKSVMPKVPVKAKKSPPKKKTKIDGTLTSLQIKWEELMISLGLPTTYDKEIEYIKSYQEPNPQSVSQVKDWLLSMGWKPEIFNDSFTVSGEVNKVPQIKDKEKNLCKSVLKLVEKTPEIKELEDLSLLQHRRGYLVGFLRDKKKDDTIVGDIRGLTNTLRIRHRTLVNLIKPSAPYGEYVRSLLLPPEGHIMIGSDLSGLESITRNNFVYDIDRDFVEEQSHPYFDPHLDIGEVAGLITPAESMFYKWWKAYGKDKTVKYEDIGQVTEDFRIIIDSYKTNEEKEEFFNKLDKIRNSAKTTNYSAMYKIGKVKLSKELKITQTEAQKLLDAYWKKNHCVKVFSESCEIKTVDGQMWVKNPINGYWYSLRSEKDIFSTVNQSAGDYIFTLWEYNLIKLGVIIRFNAHDEIVTTCKPEDKDSTVTKIKKALDMVNKQLKLKIPIQLDYKIGNHYAEVH